MFKKWCYLDNRSTIIDWFEFLKHNEIMASGNNLLNNNALTICFEFIIPTGINNTLQNKTVASNEVGCRIILDLEDLFKSKKYSDFIITASCGQRFEVHKVILAARCNIFAAMFDSDMLERRENKVDISDIDGKTMYQLLSFIYTGQVNLHQDNALQVMQASEKYNIIDLKQKCEIILWESVSIENVAEIFTIANICNAKQLKNKCLNFMAENQKDVIKTSGFKTMAKRDDVDLSEMLSYFVK
ncbi:speckle-type POZ protein-like isoform X2 [Phymastichus coffea]|nr:speckle-type POZ protein-like isoform X2 [Phymastichus coffea]